ncbi:hypothetical protein Tco_0111363 [Tanacetum coccineum]
MSILNKSLTGKALRIDRAREPIAQILWGVVKAENVDFVELLWEDFRYAAKGERKPTFRMPIPEAILRGLMRKGVVPKPKKKKDAALKRSKLITAEDNVLSNPDEALEYAKQVSIDETKKQEKERQTKHKHAGIWLEQQVNKVIDDGIESKKQAILEEIKRKDTREGLGAPQESPNHSSSSNDSFESATDDKTESERDSDHDDSENDSETRDESDKSNSNEENVESDESDKDSDNGDQNEDFVKE